MEEKKLEITEAMLEEMIMKVTNAWVKIIQGVWTLTHGSYLLSLPYLFEEGELTKFRKYLQKRGRPYRVG